MSFGNQDGVLRGPQVPPVPLCSLAEYLLQKLKAHPKDKIIQVDSETGATQTCGEFLTASTKLSEGLRKLGVNEEDVVAILSRNCTEAGEIVFATWLRGATIAPINGFMKVPELKHSLGLVKPKFVFCEEEMLKNVRAALAMLYISPIIVTTDAKDGEKSHRTIEDLYEDVDVENYEARPVKSPATQLVAVLPSSGTSGLSKGVGITHTNLIFQEENIQFLRVFREGRPCLMVSHLFWVTGVLAFVKSINKGMKRIFMKHVTPNNILKAIEEQKPEWMFMAPLSLVSVTNSPEFGLYDVSSLKTIIVGGAPFTRGIADKLKGKWDHATLIQAYGSTEVTGTAVGTQGSEDIFSVGTVMPGVELKIVDLKTEKNLMANALGEIRIKSPGIMKHYVGNEKASKDAIDKSGWVRTGDLGYYDESGQIYIVDRIAEILKVMNMQVSPAEIEKELLLVDGVSEVAVAGVTHDENQYIAAVVVKEKGSSVTEEDIHSHVGRTLSEYKKLTGGVYFVESLPKTATGKVQRIEMRKLAQSLFSSSIK